MPVGPLELYLRFLVAGLSLLLAVVAVLAYRRSPNRRLLFVAGALGLFVAVGGAMVYAAFEPSFGEHLLLVLTVLDVGILALLYLSMIQPVTTHG